MDSLSRKRRRPKKELRLQEKVEVRSVEDGFQGSWHPATIIACQRQGRNVTYKVKYHHILEDSGSDYLVDQLHVSLRMDEADGGNAECCHSRGLIRQPPPQFRFGKYDLPYGMCVDVHYQDGWWEGVIFDHEDGSLKRKVFFPDLGDEMITSIDDLRITQDWDEINETWQCRGTWLFLELVEKYERKQYIPVSVKQLWYDLRQKASFQKLGEWTSTVKFLWKDLVLEVIGDNLKVVRNHLFQVIGLPEVTQQQPLEINKSVNNVILSPKEGLIENHSIKPVENALNDSLQLCPGSTNVETTPHRCRAQQLESSSIEGNVNLLRDSTISCNDGSKTLLASPANLHEIPVVGSIIHDEGFCSSDSSKIKMKTSGSACAQTGWLPAGPDIVPGAEFCPVAVIKYAEMGNKRPRHDVINDVRKHLLHLKWKIEFMREPRMIRLRYTSPNGKLYYSLRQVCLDLSNLERGALSPTSQGQQSSLRASPADSSSHIEQPPENRVPYWRSQAAISSTSDEVSIEPEYCPETIEEWCNFGPWKKSSRKKKHADTRQIILRARKHLAALGWVFGYTNHNGRRMFYHRSPMGKTYYSLLQACKDIADEGKGTATSRDMEIDSHAQNTSLPKSRSGMKSRDLTELQNKKEYDRPVCVLRSNKRVQDVVVSDSSNNPRTVLSWLVDNNVILPRAKVHYRSKNRNPIVKGHITRYGIKCSCCGKSYSPSGFELHAESKCRLPATSKYCKPAANIFLEDGRSLLDCQIQIMCDEMMSNCRAKPPESLKSSWHHGENDYICSVCHYGGELILCDQCPSAFHKTCLGLKDIPDGDWFCPSCCCKICGQSKLEKGTKNFTDGFFNCTQCEHKYHIMCLRNRGSDKQECYHKEENWFCSNKCEEIFLGLHKLLGKPIPGGVDNLSWTLFKFIEPDNRKLHSSDTDALAETYTKLNIALDVMHECFEPVEEPHTKRDLMKDVIFSKGSELNRLNFRGFYTILLEKDEAVITVGTVRVYGDKVAEIPLVGTRSKYRRLGMCRVLMNMLEKKLKELGVQKLVLPAVPSVLNTWTGSFGFSKMLVSQRLQYVDHTFLDFQDTVMCQKQLMEMPYPQSSSLREIQPMLLDDVRGSGNNVDVDASSAVSEVLQTAQIEEGGTVEQGPVEVTAGTSSNGCKNPLDQAVAVSQPNNHDSDEPCHTNINQEQLIKDSACKLESRAYNNGPIAFNSERRWVCGGELKCYKRRKTLACANSEIAH